MGFMILKGYKEKIWEKKKGDEYTKFDKNWMYMIVYDWKSLILGFYEWKYDLYNNQNEKF